MSKKRTKAAQAAKTAADYDYVNKLNDAEKEWLNNFTKAEYFNDHKALAEIKGKVTKKDRKYLNGRDHARRRDIFNNRGRIEGEGQIKVTEVTPERDVLAKEDIRLSVSKPQIQLHTKGRKRRKRR